MKHPRINYITSLLAVAAWHIVFPLIAFAAPLGGTADDIITPIAISILTTVQVLVTVVFTLSLVAFGWGVVQFIYASNNPAALAKAKAFLLWGVIAMAITASIFGVISFMRSYIGVSKNKLIIPLPTVDVGTPFII